MEQHLTSAEHSIDSLEHTGIALNAFAMRHVLRISMTSTELLHVLHVVTTRLLQPTVVAERQTCLSAVQGVAHIPWRRAYDNQGPDSVARCSWVSPDVAGEMDDE